MALFLKQKTPLKIKLFLKVSPMRYSIQQEGYTRQQTIAVLVGSSIMLTMSMGMRQSWGLFSVPITQELGISVADFMLAIAVQNLVWGATQPVVGAYADRFGSRWITLLWNSAIRCGNCCHDGGDKHANACNRAWPDDWYSNVMHCTNAGDGSISACCFCNKSDIHSGYYLRNGVNWLFHRRTTGRGVNFNPRMDDCDDRIHRALRDNAAGRLLRRLRRQSCG